MKKIVLILLLFNIFFIGCTTSQLNQTVPKDETIFLDRLNNVDRTTSYTINEYTRYQSSGGGRRSNETREIQTKELNDLITELKAMDIVGSFTSGTKSCYYSVKFFVCFEDHKIVNYIKNVGPFYFQWSVVGYTFDIKRSTIITSISNLKKCKVDSDCTLTGNGVCYTKDICMNNPSHCICMDDPPTYCDSGCRTSINSKHYLIWDFVPLVEDKCVTDKCASYEKKEYFVASCNNSVCESVMITK